MKVPSPEQPGLSAGPVARALVHAGAKVPRPHAHRRRSAKPGRVAGRTGCMETACDRDSLRQALHGCRQLYHVAAHYALWAKDPSIFYDINVTGTRNILEAAREVGVERSVYCSTIGAIGLPPGGGPGYRGDAGLAGTHGGTLQTIQISCRAGSAETGARRPAVVIVTRAHQSGPRT